MSERVSTAWLAICAWALFSALAVWLSLRGGALALDTDSSMKLVGVRDLLAGQNWFDTAQHRMDAPFGLPMHWSRLADLGPALLIVLLRPLLGPQSAETVMLYAWPLLVFLAVLMALARIAAHLGGRSAALIVLPLALLCAETWGMFTPGGIDHHNLQAALMLWTLLFLIEKRPGAAACTIAASLCIGLETLPHAIVAILVACLWLGEKDDRARRFGIWLAGAALLLLFAVTASAYRFAPVCDTYSEFYAVLLAAGGGGLALVAMLPRRRMAGLAVVACGVIALAGLLNRDCFLGPFVGIDPHLREIFLDRINEARTAFAFAHLAPSEFFAVYIYAAFALIAGLFAARTRAAWLVALFAVVALGIATAEIREVRFAISFALPGLAAAIARFVLPRGPVLAATAMLLVSDASFALVGAEIEGVAQQAVRIKAFQAQFSCGERNAMAPLNRLAPGRVAAFVDQGPAVLLHTPDSVIAGPYHRDADGIEDMYAIFTGTDAQAHAILKRRGIAYLMTCRAAPDWTYYIGRAPDGLLAHLAQGKTPSWLMPAGQAGDTRVWKIAPD